MCCRRRAVGKRLSTGQSLLIVRVSHSKEKCRHGIKPFLHFWSEWRDSNSRHPAPKAGALPTALHPDTMGHYTPPALKNQSNFATNSKNKWSVFPPQHIHYITQHPTLSTIFYPKVLISPICTIYTQLFYPLFHLEKQTFLHYYIDTKR